MTETTLIPDGTSLSDTAIIIVMGEGSMWRYGGCGLSDVYVVGGVNEVGGNWLQFGNLDELHSRIADEVLARPQLSGATHRFLRKELFLTVAEAASLSGVAAEALAEWEKGTAFAVADAERNIRGLYQRWRETGVLPDLTAAQAVA